MTVTPLFDFFKRGEVDRDVRLLAAQGGLAPRAHEQLSILVFLLDDGDPNIRQTAESTLGRIPVAVLSGFLARSDVSIGLREFFAGRGIFPAETATAGEEAEQPLIEADATEGALSAAEEGADRERLMQRSSKMTFPAPLEAATTGSSETR